MYAIGMGAKVVQIVPGACSLALDETKPSPWVWYIAMAPQTE